MIHQYHHTDQEIKKRQVILRHPGSGYPIPVASAECLALQVLQIFQSHDPAPQGHPHLLPLRRTSSCRSFDFFPIPFALACSILLLGKSRASSNVSRAPGGRILSIKIEAMSGERPAASTKLSLSRVRLHPTSDLAVLHPANLPRLRPPISSPCRCSISRAIGFQNTRASKDTPQRGSGAPDIRGGSFICIGGFV